MFNRTAVTILVLVFFVGLLALVAWKAWAAYDEAANNTLHRDNFDVYLINLGRNKDRLQHFVAQMQRSDLRFKTIYRYEAVNGKALDIKPPMTSEKAYKEITDAEKHGFRTKHYQLTRGAIGCYLSHLNIYKMFLQSGRNYLLVFEDDVVIVPDVYKRLNAALRVIPKGWDIVLLGCHCIVCQKHETFSATRRFFFTHAMLISREGAQKIVAHLDGRPIEQQIDAVLSNMSEKDMLSIYCLNDPIVRQSQDFKTTIQIPLKKVKGINPYSRE